MVLIKRRLNNKSLYVKCKALKDLEKGMTNKNVTAKYAGSKNTLPTWVKNKYKLATSLEKPRCFKNVKQLPYRYKPQKKSWITGVLFEE